MGDSSVQGVPVPLPCESNIYYCVTCGVFEANVGVKPGLDYLNKFDDSTHSNSKHINSKLIDSKLTNFNYICKDGGHEIPVWISSHGDPIRW